VSYFFAAIAKNGLQHTPHPSAKGINMNKLRLRTPEGLACIRRLIEARSFYTCAMLAVSIDLIAVPSQNERWKTALAQNDYQLVKSNLVWSIWNEYQELLGQSFHPEFSELWSFGEFTRYPNPSASTFQVPEEFRRLK
jgi:hypothetical protein